MKKRLKVKYPHGLYVANIPHGTTVVQISENGIFELAEWSDNKVWFTPITITRFKQLVSLTQENKLISFREIGYKK
jgi:hypothetical protein